VDAPKPAHASSQPALKQLPDSAADFPFTIRLEDSWWVLLALALAVIVVVLYRRRRSRRNGR
jgi:bacteriorhodopsin